MQVQFFEAASEAARTGLKSLAAALRERGADLLLLKSEDQPELLLLLVQGDTPEIAVPAGIRHWRFHEIGDAW